MSIQEQERGSASELTQLLWRDISTAPKWIDWVLLGYYPDYMDGKPQGGHPVIAYWDGDTWIDCCGHKLNKYGEFSPTHWMPLPPAP